MKGKKKEDFDYQNFEQQALKAMYEGKSLEQALGPLLKRLVEAGLQGELQAHLEEVKASGAKNRRNGKTEKSVRSRFGALEIETPRDRSNTYEPILVPAGTTAVPPLALRLFPSLANLLSYPYPEQRWRAANAINLSKLTRKEFC